MIGDIYESSVLEAFYDCICNSLLLGGCAVEKWAEVNELRGLVVGSGV